MVSDVPVRMPSANVPVVVRSSRRFGGGLDCAGAALTHLPLMSSQTVGVASAGARPPLGISPVPVQVDSFGISEA
jgi:hypothetical protein